MLVPLNPWLRTRPGIPMDAYRTDDAFVVQFDLPGVDPETIELTVEEKVLTVGAERPAAASETGHALVRERVYGALTRRLYLGDQVDADAVTAAYDRGVLTLTLPFAAAAKPRKIEIAA